MIRWRRVLGWLSFAFVLSFAWRARADDSFSMIHVCVRPPTVPEGVVAWVFTGSMAIQVVKIPRADFKRQSGGLTTYVYDPFAPPDSVKLFPKQWANLQCPPPPQPVKPTPPPEARKDPPKDEKKPSGTGGDAVTTDPKKTAEKKKDKDKEEEEEPPDLPKPLIQPPPPEWHPMPPKGGVTESWPATVLPILQKPALLPSVESGHGVLPIAGLDNKGTLLPMANRPPPAGQKSGTSEDGKDETKRGDGVKKTPYEKFCEQVGLLGGLAGLQLNEDIKSPGGSKYGIPGGKNANGIKSPTAQAVAGAVMVASAAITAGGFDKKLYDALAKGTPFVIRGGGKAGELAAEKLVQDAITKYGQHGAEDLAAALAKNGAIGEYSVMAKFTKGLGARWQAHHILEQQMAKELGLGATDRIPAVILSEAEHKAITKALNAELNRGKSLEVLWKAYKKVYANHPAWLKAIEGYFHE